MAKRGCSSSISWSPWDHARSILTLAIGINTAPCLNVNGLEDIMAPIVGKCTSPILWGHGTSRIPPRLQMGSLLRLSSLSVTSKQSPPMDHKGHAMDLCNLLLITNLPLKIAMAQGALHCTTIAGWFGSPWANHETLQLLEVTRWFDERMASPISTPPLETHWTGTSCLRNWIHWERFRFLFLSQSHLKLAAPHSTVTLA